MEVNLKRIDENYLMEATNETGNTLLTDGSPAIGGGNQAFRPMQMLLAAIGGCSSIDIISLLRKQRQELEDIQIKVTAERVEGEVPALFKSIHIHYILIGDVSEKKAERAVNLSMEKYCSVSMIIKESAEIRWSFEVQKGSGVRGQESGRA